MTETTQNIPFLRITIAFAIGILVAGYARLSPLTAGIILTVSWCLLLFLNRNYTFRSEKPFGFLVAVLFISLGYQFYSSHNKKTELLQQGTFVATVLEVPQEKNKSIKSLLKFNTCIFQDSVYKTNEKVLAYFSKTEKAKQLKPGSVILVKSVPQEIQNAGNPYEFDYKKYLERKKVFRQVYLPEEKWQPTHSFQHSITTYAEAWREKLLRIYRCQKLGSKEQEILSALTLGYKRELDKETKRVFSAAGAMHVLAVSGLHVGIIFWVFSSVFGFLRKRKYGKYLFIFLSVSILWCYAFITGLSPSVLRASTMFSLLAIASNINRKASIYNSLFVSAFLLLIINPNNLFEVGFQLSYSAVFGIVFLQPKLEKLWPVQNKIIKYFWSLLTVSLAAQIATFPITTFYFNQFPTYFWASNLIVIPVAFILIILGVLLLVFSPVPIIASILALLTNEIIRITYSALQCIENLPYSVLSISLYQTEFILLLISLFSLFLFIKYNSAKNLRLVLGACICFSLSILLNNTSQKKTNELIVFNQTKNNTIALISGKKYYIVSENEIKTSDFEFRQIEDLRHGERLNAPIMLSFNCEYEDKNLLIRNGILAFNRKIIQVKRNGKKLNDSLKTNFLITPANNYTVPSEKYSAVVSTAKYFKHRTNENIHFLKLSGAFHTKW